MNMSINPSQAPKNFQVPVMKLLVRAKGVLDIRHNLSVQLSSRFRRGCGDFKNLGPKVRKL